MSLQLNQDDGRLMLNLSQFIEVATGISNGIGDNLEPCTTDISATKVTFLGKDAFGVVFVDTPGFDEITGSDGKVLEMIAQWLKRRFVTLPLYFHRRDVRVLL